MTIKLDISPRRTGRTERMIDWMGNASDGYKHVIICSTVEQSKQVLKRAQVKYPHIEDWQVQLFSSLHQLRGRSNIRVGIDNLEMMLESLFAYPIDYITGTLADGSLYGFRLVDYQ